MFFNLDRKNVFDESLKGRFENLKEAVVQAGTLAKKERQREHLISYGKRHHGLTDVLDGGGQSSAARNARLKILDESD